MKSAMMAKPADKNIQSGNSRVKVTLYGQVNRAIRFANTGDNTEITSVDNDGFVLAPRRPGGRQGQPEPDDRRPARARVAGKRP